MAWPKRLTYAFLPQSVAINNWKLVSKFYKVSVCIYSSSKFEQFTYMAAGAPSMEAEQDFELNYF